MTNDSRNISQFLKDERGFTLIEILLVFFIFIILLSSIPPIVQSLQNSIVENNFLQQFEEDLFFAQSLAISRNQRVYFEYDTEEYVIRNFWDEVYIKREIPEMINMLPSYMNSFYFKGSGNVSKFGNIYVEVGDQMYRIYISIGRGRFEIYE